MVGGAEGRGSGDESGDDGASASFVLGSLSSEREVRGDNSLKVWAL